MTEKRNTPLLDELEKGPWPSFVKEIKKEAGHNPMASDELRILERSYEEHISHWKHGGLVGVDVGEGADRRPTARGAGAAARETHDATVPPAGAHQA